MAVVRNETLQRLRSGLPALGLSVSLVRSPAIAQIARTTGYHWIAIDGEHSAFGPETTSDLCLAALAAGVTPIVRTKQEALHEAARALDCGAQGILVPGVNSPAQAARVVSYLRYGPRGRRSWGGGSPGFHYAPPPLVEALASSDAETLVAVMIETPVGLADVDAIAGVEGVDVLFVGASDLSIELGAPGEFAGVVMQDAFCRVAEACQRAGKVMGVGGVYDEALFGRLLQMGARFIAGGGDQAFLMGAATARARMLVSLAGAAA